jgi:hypothetical protein
VNVSEQELPELEIEGPESVEESSVAAWRIAQFRSLGFGGAVAELLGWSEADLALARSLVASDCPLDLAARILL